MYEGNRHTDSNHTMVTIWELNQKAQLMLQFIKEQDLHSPYNEIFHMGAEAQIGFNWSPKKDYDPNLDIHKEEVINKYNLLGLR